MFVREEASGPELHFGPIKGDEYTFTSSNAEDIRDWWSPSWRGSGRDPSLLWPYRTIPAQVREADANTSCQWTCLVSLKAVNLTNAGSRVKSENTF